ncbi:MAG: 4Fe-4S binding protein [Coriobacteriia bacterium]|nr:4Fe-4S binding protein [Coriobacteriia bacterium]MCL2746048.1 4Fe-4S binding protein [Coriobacteriia bacterium]MCL2870042.1 4Fe-4S binding protein [Coriobacteriia bacterium]
MLRKVIQIDEAKCTGCGQCVLACRESAIGFENGKAKLMREDHCDGLGLCMPVCLADAITFIEKDVSPAGNTAHYADKEAAGSSLESSPVGGCPGVIGGNTVMQWPLQIKLVPIVADYFDGADLLIAADCSAYTYPKFQQEYAEGKTRIIGCPKLDEGDYTEKLSEIFANNNLASITVTRIEVPCCDGIERAVRRAVKMSGKDIPVRSVMFSIEGTILYDGE